MFKIKINERYSLFLCVGLVIFLKRPNICLSFPENSQNSRVISLYIYFAKFHIYWNGAAMIMDQICRRDLYSFVENVPSPHVQGELTITWQCERENYWTLFGLGNNPSFNIINSFMFSFFPNQNHPTLKKCILQCIYQSKYIIFIHYSTN